MKGKILKVKIGYNPNSSSVGSAIPAYIVTTAAVGAVSVLISNIIASARKNIKKKMKLENKNSPKIQDKDDSK